MICVDSSVAAKWFFDEDNSDQATALLNSALAAAESIVAPHMLPSEVTNIIRQRIRRGLLTGDAGFDILAGFLAIPIAIQAPSTLYRRALAIANAHNLPAVYDAHYIALAEITGATFWTADLRLIRAISDNFPFVRSIADYVPAS